MLLHNTSWIRLTNEKAEDKRRLHFNASHIWHHPQVSLYSSLKVVAVKQDENRQDTNSSTMNLTTVSELVLNHGSLISNTVALHVT
jgi:hypothetical protein